MIFYISKQLSRLTVVVFAFLGLSGTVTFAQLPAPQIVGTAEPLPDNSQAPDNSQNGNNSDNSQNNPNDQSQNQNNQNNNNNNNNNQNNPNGTNPQNPNGTQPVPPGIPNAQTPSNPTSVNAPLIPQASNSPYAPLLPTAEGQPTQYSTPQLYTTGQYDLSQTATTTALMQAFGGQTIGFSSEQGMSYSNPPIERLRLGPFDVKAAMTTTVVSDDNINAGQSSGPGSTGQKKTDTIFGLTPALLVIYGDHDGQRGYASLVYSPTLTRYYHDSAEDNDNQNVAFAATYPLQRITLDVSDTFLQTTGVNQDVGARTTQTSNDAHFGLNYGVDDRLSVYSTVEQLDTSYAQGGGNSDHITTLTSTAAYTATDKLTVGPEVKFGVERPDHSPQQTFEDILGTANYQATDKINVSGSGGVEWRQGGSSSDSTFGGSNNSGNGDSISPVFSVGLGYKPFDSTQLSTFAFESVQSSSGNPDQNVTNTGAGFSASQRFLHRFFFGFTFYYSHSEYTSNTSTTTKPTPAMTTGATVTAFTGTAQDNFVYRPSLSFSPTEWSNIAFYYQYLANQATGASTSYHDNQMGASLSFQF